MRKLKKEKKKNRKINRKKPYTGQTEKEGLLWQWVEWHKNTYNLKITLLLLFHSVEGKEDLNLNEAFRGMAFLSHGSACMDLTHNCP